VNGEWVPYEWILNDMSMSRDGWEKHAAACERPPKWLGSYPEMFPADITLPNGKRFRYDSKYEIPRDVCGVFEKFSPIKWAHERGIRFAPGSDFEKELASYMLHLENEAARDALIRKLRGELNIEGVKITLSANAASALYLDLSTRNEFKHGAFTYSHPVEFE
jgi:hypothetical protein